MAFSYRNYEAEVDFLIAAYREATASDGLPSAVLEIASGSGHHARELARRGVEAIGVVDNAHDMIESATELLADCGAEIEVLESDMRDFRTSKQYDLAICMIDSLSHIISTDDLIRHFRTVRAALKVGGAYIIELAWPTLDGESSRTSDHWIAENEYISVEVFWGEGAEILDAKRRVSSVPVTFIARDKRRIMPTEMISYTYTGREWTFQTVAAAVSLAGRLSIAATYADFSLAVPYVPNGEGWRMILVLVCE